MKSSTRSETHNSLSNDLPDQLRVTSPQNSENEFDFVYYTDEEVDPSNLRDSAELEVQRTLELEIPMCKAQMNSLPLRNATSLNRQTLILQEFESQRIQDKLKHINLQTDSMETSSSGQTIKSMTLKDKKDEQNPDKQDQLRSIVKTRTSNSRSNEFYEQNDSNKESFEKQVPILAHLAKDIAIASCIMASIRKPEFLTFETSEFTKILVNEISFDKNFDQNKRNKRPSSNGLIPRLCKLVIDAHSQNDLHLWAYLIKNQNVHKNCILDNQFLPRSARTNLFQTLNEALIDFIRTSYHSQDLNHLKDFKFLEVLKNELEARNLQNTFKWTLKILGFSEDFKESFETHVSKPKEPIPKIEEFEQNESLQTCNIPIGNDPNYSIPKPHNGTIILLNIGKLALEFEELKMRRDPFVDLSRLVNSFIQRNPNWIQLDELQLFRRIGSFYDLNSLPITVAERNQYHQTLQEVFNDLRITLKVISK